MHTSTHPTSRIQVSVYLILAPHAPTAPLPAACLPFPGTVRYAAHDNGLLAEELTQDIIDAYVNSSYQPNTGQCPWLPALSSTVHQILCSIYFLLPPPPFLTLDQTDSILKYNLMDASYRKSTSILYTYSWHTQNGHSCFHSKYVKRILFLFQVYIWVYFKILANSSSVTLPLLPALLGSGLSATFEVGSASSRVGAKLTTFFI